MVTYFDVFISYGRRESKQFATTLAEQLQQQGLNVWFDQNDIPPTVDFQKQIDDGIERSHNVIFIIAPHSAQSLYCRKEVELATTHKKRIIPLLHIDPAENLEKLPSIIKKRNWIFFDGSIEYNTALEQLFSAIAHEADYVQQHTELLNSALNWEHHYRRHHALLFDKKRAQAVTWLKKRFDDGQNQAPCEPTYLQCEYIGESTKNANNLMTQVFLSSIDADKALLDQISYALMRQAWTVWRSENSLKLRHTFNKNIQQGIEEADNFLYLVTTASLQHPVCQQQLHHALQCQKRIILLLLEPVELQEELAHLPIIDCRHLHKTEQSEEAIKKLINLLSKDAAYHEQHKTLLVKALKWQAQNKNISILLHGYNLQKALSWLSVAETYQHYTALPLHSQFIQESQKQPLNNTQNVFISYSRADADFARRLNNNLQLMGKTTWFDQENIATGADFFTEIKQGIESSDNFLFIISPDAINSPYCEQEVEFAQQLGKRTVTLLYRPVNNTDLHPALAKVQWLDFRQSQDDFNITFRELIRALEIDREHVRQHTKWLQRAREWEQKQKSKDVLLRGEELVQAEAWQREAREKIPACTMLQHDYITASQTEYSHSKRQTRLRWILFAVMALLILSLAPSSFLYLEAKKSADLATHMLERAHHTQSLFLADLARQQNEAGNYFEATALSLNALPRDISKNERPYVIEATKQLYDALLNLHERHILIGHDNAVTQLDVNKSNRFIVSSSRNTVKIWDKKKNYSPKTLLKTPHIINRTLFNLQGTQVFSHDGKDGLLWTTQTLNQPIRLQGHSKTIIDAAFSPDGRYLATAGDDDIVLLWDMAGRKIRQFAQHTSSVLSVAFSPDGKKIISTSWDKTAHVVNVATGELLFSTPPHTLSISKGYFSPDGDYILTISGYSINVWNAYTGEYLHALAGHKKAINALQFTVDGQHLISFGADKSVLLWDFARADLIQKLGKQKNAIIHAALSPNGQWLAVADQKTVKLWDLRLQQLHTTLKGHTAVINKLHFNHDSSQLITASADRNIRIWATKSNAWQQILTGHSAALYQARFSPNGKLALTAATDNRLNVWQIKPRKQLFSVPAHQARINHAIFSPNSQYIVTTSYDRSAKLWDSHTGKRLHTLTAHKNNVSYAAFSPDSRRLITVGYDNNAYLWNVRTGKLIRELTGHKNRIYFTAFSPDGRYVVTTSRDNTARLWDMQDINNYKVLAEHQSYVPHATFSADGQYLVTASYDDNAYIWQVKTGKLLYKLVGHQNYVSYTAFSPDGKLVATSSYDKTVRIWQRSTGDLVHILRAHDATVFQIHFSPSGEQLLSASGDGTAHLWDVKSGKSLAELRGHTGMVFSAYYNKKGNGVITASRDKTARLWRVFPDAQALIDHGHKIKPRDLTAEERQRFFIDSE